MSRASASVRDRPTTRPYWHGSFGPRGTDRRDRLLLVSHGDEELLNKLLDQILTTAHPLPGARDVGGKQHLWGHWDAFYGWRAWRCAKSESGG